MTRSVTLPDGRELAYEEYGDRGGEPVLSFHGGLSSRLDAAPAHQAALDLGVRLLSPDRPGIGRSTYQPGRRLLDWPADVAALTDALGIDRSRVTQLLQQGLRNLRVELGDHERQLQEL